MGDVVFELDKLEDMAIVQTSRLLFTSQGAYYEIRASKDTCIRKYYLFNNINKIIEE